MYICRITSVSKIETNNAIFFFRAVVLCLTLQIVTTNLYFLSPFPKLKSIYSLYSFGRQGILLLISIYLILGLVARIFFIEKLQGPLKSFYAK